MKQYRIVKAAYSEDLESMLNRAAVAGFRVAAVLDAPNHFYLYTMERDLTEAEALQMREHFGL